jgi:UDP-N-acetylmuramoyl-tripeptide--D-alanyl-D-alanine ligase
MKASIELIYEKYLQFPTVATDTRTVKAGSIFFALKGANFNGNEFAAQALASGAAYAVVDQIEFAINEQYLLVDDVLKALQALANHHRKQLSIPFLGITGSNGKTTSKELINAVLAKKFQTLATFGNLNNHIGVPLTLLGINASHQFAIIEMGANHQKEIAELCEIAAPTYGLICNIGKAHLEGMGGFEGVKKTKKELYDYIESTSGTVFVNADDAITMELSAALNNKIYFGSNSESLLSGSIQSLAPMLCVAITFKKSAQTHIVQTQLVGDYNLANILAAACIGEYFKVPEQEIVAAIAGYTPTNNRSQIMQTANNELIMDAYNANPSSMFAAVNNFQQLLAPNKYLILGDMFELGEESIAEHQAIVSLVAELKFEKVIFVGKDFYQAAAENKIASFQFFESTANASDYLLENSISAHTILIKGSRGMKLESLLPLL